MSDKEASFFTFRRNQQWNWLNLFFLSYLMPHEYPAFPQGHCVSDWLTENQFPYLTTVLYIEYPTTRHAKDHIIL